MIWTGVGGSVGALLRYLLAGMINEHMEERTFIPIGTWVVNSAGSFILGALFSLQDHGMIDQYLWLLLGIGFCGAFTTFSTFGYETVTLLRLKRWRSALVYVTGSALLSVIAVWFGLVTMSALI